MKVKEFNVKFGAGKNDKLESGWVNLQLTPGDYKLRAVWSDTTSRGAAEGEWTGKLTTCDVDFKLAAANAAPAAASEAPKAEKPKPETPKGADAAAPFRDKLAELDAKIAALKMERVKLSETLAPNHPKIRKLDAEVEALDEARASFVATNPQALSPKPPAASQPASEIVFITRDTKAPPKLDAGDGVTVAVHNEISNGADIWTTARLRWTGKADSLTGHDVVIGGDLMGHRAKWAVAWVRGTKTLWHVDGGFDGNRLELHRTEFADSKRIVTDYEVFYGAEPLDGLGIPAEVRAKFEQHFGWVNPKPAGRPKGNLEVGGKLVSAAQPLLPNGSAPQRKEPDGRDRHWTVQFVNVETGQPISRPGATITSRTADGSRTSHVTSSGSEDPVKLNFPADTYGWVSVVDESWSNADDAVRLFGNVPAEAQATQKHTDPDAPFIVKVKPRGKQVKAGADAAKPAAKPPGENKVEVPDGNPLRADRANVFDRQSPKAVVDLMENYLQAHDYGNYNNLLTDDEARRVAGDLLHTYGETPEGIPETRYSKNLRTMIEDIMSRHLRDHPPTEAIAAGRELRKILPQYFYQMKAIDAGGKQLKCPVTAEKLAELHRQSSGLLTDPRAFSSAMMIGFRELEISERRDAIGRDVDTVKSEWRIEITDDHAIATQMARPIAHSIAKAEEIRMQRIDGSWKITNCHLNSFIGRDGFGRQ